MIPAEDVAWCAGVIDVVGHVQVRTTDAGTALAAVSVSTPHGLIADRLAELTGTSTVVVSRDYKRVGCSNHCTEPHLHVVSVTARWSLTGARAVTFLSAIAPHLRFKRDEVARVLAETADAPSKPATAQKMTALGWPPVGGAA